MSFAALLLAAAVSSAAPPPGTGTGVELASARVAVVILTPAIVRQGGGPEIDPNAPAPQIRRRDGTVLVEFQ
jgi:hypothetical protein